MSKSKGLAIFSVILFIASGFFFFQSINQNKKVVNVLGECEVRYAHLNKRLGCEPKPAIKKHEYTELILELKKYIEEQESNKKVKHVSVYFRDLEYGPTFGINEKEKFIPASLLKVPLLIATLSLTERDKDILSTKVEYSDNISLNARQKTDTIPQLELDKSYELNDLLSRMIIYSDNVSESLLRKYLSQEFPTENVLIQTMTDIGLVDPKSPIESTLTVKSYASLFRQLYTGSYLSPEMSEKALDLLAQSIYEEGLIAGVPSATKVAHKFGERAGLSEEEKQLHDCGIVYYPQNPYLVCIMTRGENFDEQAVIIKNISEKIYKEVDSRKY